MIDILLKFYKIIYIIGGITHDISQAKQGIAKTKLKYTNKVNYFTIFTL